MLSQKDIHAGWKQESWKGARGSTSISKKRRRRVRPRLCSDGPKGRSDDGQADLLMVLDGMIFRPTPCRRLQDDQRNRDSPVWRIRILKNSTALRSLPSGLSFASRTPHWGPSTSHLEYFEQSSNVSLDTKPRCCYQIRSVFLRPHPF